MQSFTEAEIQRCPFPFIQQLHKEAPVYRDPVTGFWVISRYADIEQVARHPDIFSNTTTIITDKKDSPVAAQVAARFEQDGFLPMHTLVTNDPPSHSHFRALVDKVFSPKKMKELEPDIVALVESLIDDFANQKTVDIHHAFSVKLPICLVAEQLGVDPDDWQRIKFWSDVTIENINPMIDPQRELEITEHIIDMQQYLWRNVENYRQQPANTLLSNLVHAEVEGQGLEPRALISIAHQLLVAGNESTTGALSSGIYMLCDDADLRQQLCNNRSLIPDFVEEVLRIHAPSPHLYRQVLKDTMIGDIKIRAGDIVMVSYLAANHDASVFEDPDTVCLQRKNGRKHMAFGQGIHFCIGNRLARAEMRIAFNALLDRFPNMHLNPECDGPHYAEVFHVHSLDKLNIVL